MPILSGHIWLILILVVTLIIFGPGKLPQIGGAVGNAIKEFRRATSELKDEIAQATEPQVAASAAASTEANSKGEAPGAPES